MISPSILTIISILFTISNKYLQYILEFITKSLDEKTREYLISKLELFWRFIFNKSPNISNKSDNIIQEFIPHNINAIFVSVDVTNIFVQKFLNYIHTNSSSNCHFDICESNKKYKFNDSNKLLKNQIWKNIEIKYDFVTIGIESLKLQFYSTPNGILL